MKKILIIKADTNDADYITAESLVTEEELEEYVLPVVKVLKARKKEYEKTNDWTLQHNWENSECGNTSPLEMYAEQLSEHQILNFEEYLPHGEYGIHTIESIRIINVEETLF